jgi:uncharacterized iron-regulated membrane protein
MIMPHPGKLDGELGVLISLVVSLGMIILTVTGWWLWKILAAIAPVLSGVSSIEMP